MPPSPLVQAIPVKASPPSLNDNTADIDRLKSVLGEHFCRENHRSPNLVVPYPCTTTVAASFRQANFSGAAIVNCFKDRMEIIDFLPAHPPYLPAMALDLGTTHLEAVLLDLHSGKQMAHHHRTNSQIAYGADILSRIHFATQQQPPHGFGLQILQKDILADIASLATRLAHDCHLQPQAIRALAIAGNTTMIHLLLGLDPYHICREPYIPLVNAPDPFPAREVHLNLHPWAPVWILPSVGSYFGGDLVAGVLASGLDASEQTSMLIDVGTNAEVILGNQDWLIACAGAAGPALENGVARMGMRAAPGAIEHVRLDRTNWQLDLQTIDDLPASGICGSGLIDLVAELYLGQVIDQQGKLQTKVTGTTPAQEQFFRRHCTEHNGQHAFIVVPPEKTSQNQPILLSQVDLDNIIRSKAAMYAILTTLMAQVGLDFKDLAQITVAGAFGKHIDPYHAIILGMLPDLPLSTYHAVGNASLQGATMILLDKKARQRSHEIGKKITYLELNVNHEFMIRFSGARFIPHTDLSQFPSVPTF